MSDKGLHRLPEHEVIIVGAGFGGMAAAIALTRAGIDDFVMLERASEVGGVWRDNTYPGVAVDIPSFSYSYGFEPNAWSRAFAPGAELFTYAKRCAAKYGLRHRIRFDSEVSVARFDEDDHLWRLELTDGSTVTGRYLFACHGTFSTPTKPTIPGLDDFAGRVNYTMRWDHSHDLTGERVAVIGTGASALQVIPEIAPKVAALKVFQRTPIWVLPKPNPRLDGITRLALDKLPLARRSARLATDLFAELFVTFGAVHYAELPFIVGGTEAMARNFLNSQVKDPTLREKLTPAYGFGCKRPSFSNTYYRTYLRDNVELITDGIERITPNGIRTVDGIEREIDTMVLATGFKVFDVPYDLYGSAGETLNERWDHDRRQSYEGTTVHGFPNMFLTPGPYGVTGSSLFATFDICVKHAMRVIRAAHRRGATRAEVTAEAQDRFMEFVHSREGKTMFHNRTCAGSNTYYIDQHGDAPYLRPTAGVHAMWAQKTFGLNDYRFDRHGCGSVAADV
ncbi:MULTISPECIES: NAD(P)/FAD-dependent oxidoreductase [unclassified Nocardia]|uniref:flavin-containing monooxygenase n=1 Tax=unclassified Nocardia TaxID=2637762 RepID=UPI001CE48354|nr:MULTISPECIES: NAD(P)/FAD-dependent oxidoreductase [unclassified Nocardia]